MMPLVTIAVPLFNHSSYIDRCLDSIIEDGYPNLELVILDDGSSDDSLQKARGWVESHKERFKQTKVWSQPNSGVCKTLNRLISEASGLYVTLLASDDALKTGGIQERVNFLEHNKHLLAVFGDAEVIDEEDNIVASSAIQGLYRASKSSLASPKRISKELILKWCVPGPVFLARREAWDPTSGVGQYDENLRAEDRDFYLRLLSRNALAFLDVVVARYRVHGQNSCLTPGQGVSPDVHQSEINNLHRFKGIDKLSLYLCIKKRAYKIPKRPIPYRSTRVLASLLKHANRIGLFGR